MAVPHPFPRSARPRVAVGPHSSAPSAPARLAASAGLRGALVVLVLLAGGTLVLRWTELDVGVERFFYSDDLGWFLRGSPLVDVMYGWGLVPSFLLFAGAATILLWSVLTGKRLSWRRPALFLTLLFLLAPGLITNGILKPHWHRPRPRETAELGGTDAFLPVLSAPDPGEGESFPSGHAAVAFYLAAPYFVLRRRRRRLALGFLLVGTLYGLLMGLTRIAVGGHYPSDVLWAWGVTYGLGFLLAPLA